MTTAVRSPLPSLTFLLALLSFCLASRASGAGVTVITHGFNGNAQGWVLGMAGKIPGYFRFPGTNVICYEVVASFGSSFNVTSRKLAGGDPTNDFNAEIVIKLDWGDLAGFFDQYDTYEVAAVVVPRFLQTNFIAELNGRALAELPLHLIGHSRGGSLVCQMARLFGTNGVWVDQVTTLDPHPVNEDGNTDPLLVSDAPLRIYENVLFADNYYQDFGGYPHGQSMPSSYNRRSTTLPGGYSSAHSDMHLWYHATIDLFNPADDTEAMLIASDRAAWFTTYESSGSRGGFHYGRLGGGNRLSVDRPVNTDPDYPAKGYNQYWNFGAGSAANRTLLPANHGNWPNPIRFNLTGTNQMAQGQSNSITLYYQWAKPATSNATVSVYLDDDYNPWNGNGRVVGQWAVPGTTSNNVGLANLSINVAATNTTPGIHSLYARIDGGGRTRYLYAPELLTVFSSLQPPRLDITRGAGPQIRVDVTGVPGQRIVLESATDLQSWQPLATNWLATTTWSYFHTTAASAARSYRAEVR